MKQTVPNLCTDITSPEYLGIKVQGSRLDTNNIVIFTNDVILLDQMTRMDQLSYQWTDPPGVW